MNKREYAQANKEWLTAKAQEEGVKPLPKGIYYKVLAEGKADEKHPTPRSIVTRNAKDFSFSEIEVLTPSDFLAKYYPQQIL